jgi:uncharacterized protein
MRIVDANVLIYAVNSASPQHETAQQFLDASLNGAEPVGFAWVAMLAFLRITTRPGILASPLSVGAALEIVDAWLGQASAHIAHPGVRHAEILGNTLRLAGTGGNLTTDAHLAAIAIEYGAELWSFDTDFQRFSGLAYRQLKV